jgi:hypothetical protein
MLETLQAEEFHGFQTSGNSRPARTTCRRTDGTRVDVFTKFIGGVRNRGFGLCAELLCSEFARGIGLATPTPYLVDISPAFVAAAPRDAQDLLGRSLGINFATEALTPGYTVVPPEPRIPTALRRRAAEVFAFDVFIQNYDRKGDNPNLLWNRTNIYLIDHESAFNSTYSDAAPPTIASLDLDHFYDHVFYPSLSPSDCSLEQISAALGSLTARTLDGWFDAIPNSWLDDALQRVRHRLDWLIEHRQEVCTLIQDRIA